MQSVTVLTTNGRRQVVKVEPNKTVLWILEEVCKKFNFNPDNYGLKHHSKLVDLSQMFRFAGLPNNASLEMVEIEKKRDDQSVVIICLQLEDGTRLSDNFPASTTLREIIDSLCPSLSSEEHSPVVIYMRSEIHGDSLNTVTLKSLGLSSGGRALFRLLNMDPERLKFQANISAPLPQKPKEEDEQPRPRSNIEQDTFSSGLFQFTDVEQLKIAEPVNVKPLSVEEGSEVFVPTVTPEEVEMETVENAEEAIEENNEESLSETVINRLDSRGTIIFSLDSMKKSSDIDLPDSFFDLTEQEVKKLYRDLKKQVEENDNRPLMTSQLRKLEENKKILNQLSTYKFCAIRVQLPNRLVIQSRFSTVESIAVVIEFVRKFLINPEMEFHLFLTPPKTILSPDATLIESNCVPSALLHFGCNEPSDNLIKPEYLEKLSSGSSASRVLASTTDNEMIEDANGSSSSNKTTLKPTIPTNFMPSRTINEATGAVPKWFKKGK